MTDMPRGAPSEFVPIDEVASRFGIKASALRYYEEIGLLESGLRRSGRRYYGLSELRRLALIQLLQDVASMSLKEITAVVAASSDDKTARGVLEARVSALKDEIASAQMAIGYLEHRLSCSRENPFDECPVLGRELLDRLREAGITLESDRVAELLAREVRPEAESALATGIHRRRRTRPGERHRHG